MPTNHPQEPNPFLPLSDEELEELDHYLLYENDTEEGMTLDMADGFMHAVAIGPVTIYPKQWLPKIWGLETMAPPTESLEQLNHLLGLVMRHFNGIIGGLEDAEPDIYPIWTTQTFRGKEYDNAEGWAHGFTEGVKLALEAWQPLLQSEQGRQWYRPIGLLGEDDYGQDQDALTRTPKQRHDLAQQITANVLAMHAHWLPLRKAVYERETAQRLSSKVGRNDPCPCGSGQKFKKCCGAPNQLH